MRENRYAKANGSFLKKTGNFCSVVAPCGGVRDSRDKSFLLLFLEKEGLAYFLWAKYSQTTVAAASDVISLTS